MHGKGKLRQLKRMKKLLGAIMLFGAIFMALTPLLWPLISQILGGIWPMGIWTMLGTMVGIGLLAMIASVTFGILSYKINRIEQRFRNKLCWYCHYKITQKASQKDEVIEECSECGTPLWISNAGVTYTWRFFTPKSTEAQAALTRYLRLERLPRRILWAVIALLAVFMTAIFFFGHAQPWLFVRLLPFFSLGLAGLCAIQPIAGLYIGHKLRDALKHYSQLSFAEWQQTKTMSS